MTRGRNPHYAVSLPAQESPQREDVAIIPQLTLQSDCFSNKINPGSATPCQVRYVTFNKQ